MTMCFEKHPFEINTEDRLTTINTKIFEIKKKIQLSANNSQADVRTNLVSVTFLAECLKHSLGSLRSTALQKQSREKLEDHKHEGQRKSTYEENEAEKQENSNLIETLKKEIKIRLGELARARAVIGDDEIQIKKYLNELCPIGNKNVEQIIHNLDLKVIDQRKLLDLLKYERRNKKNKLTALEKEYEHLLIENSKSELVKSKITSRARKHVSHLENEIHKVLIQWTEAELVKKKYLSIRQALIDDSVKFESSLSRVEELLTNQKEEIIKLERVREVAADMRIRATAATAAQAARAHDSDHSRANERAYFAQRFTERKRELEKLEKRVFPPQTRPVVRQESTRSTDGEAVTEESSAAAQMDEIFQRLMKLTGVTDPEEVFDRFRAQRETSKRLSYLQQTTEEEKLDLEQRQTTLMAELEAFKFASVKDKDEGQDQINELKEEIRKEIDIHTDLEKRIDTLENFLLDIKRLLYDLCKLLDIIPEPVMPEWTAEARDVQELVSVLTSRYEKARLRVLDIREKNKDVTTILVPSNPTSAAASVAGISIHSHSTPKESEKQIPTYKELLEKEPVRPSASDEEEDIPSRCYLKRQAQVIVDTKCRRKGFRAYPRR